MAKHPDSGRFARLTRLRGADRTHSGKTRPDWTQRLTAFATLIAIGVTAWGFQSTNRNTEAQLKIANEGQITDRFNAAIAHLGSDNLSLRLGGVYALERIMKDSSADEPTIIEVLCAFIRESSSQAKSSTAPATDVAAALTVLGRRPDPDNPKNQIIDLSGAYLTGANLAGANLNGANLSNASLVDAKLHKATLVGANLNDAMLTRARLSEADLTRATLVDVDLTHAHLDDTNLTRADLTRAYLHGAELAGANLTGAVLNSAVLTRADLTAANLADADLTGVER